MFNSRLIYCHDDDEDIVVETILYCNIIVMLLCSVQPPKTSLCACLQEVRGSPRTLD